MYQEYTGFETIVDGMQCAHFGFIDNLYYDCIHNLFGLEASEYEPSYHE